MWTKNIKYYAAGLILTEFRIGPKKQDCIGEETHSICLIAFVLINSEWFWFWSWTECLFYLSLTIFGLLVHYRSPLQPNTSFQKVNFRINKACCHKKELLKYIQSLISLSKNRCCIFFIRVTWVGFPRVPTKLILRKHISFHLDITTDAFNDFFFFYQNCLYFVF